MELARGHVQGERRKSQAEFGKGLDYVSDSRVHLPGQEHPMAYKTLCPHKSIQTTLRGSDGLFVLLS